MSNLRWTHQSTTKPKESILKKFTHHADGETRTRDRPLQKSSTFVFELNISRANAGKELVESIQMLYFISIYYSLFLICGWLLIREAGALVLSDTGTPGTIRKDAI